MKLSDFIRANIENISAEWEKFAATLLPEEEFSASVLRNGIEGTLNRIADDMDQSQSGEQQQDKSEGHDKPDKAIDFDAERHAVGRADMGFSSRQLISEFRALRASVIRLWEPSKRTASKSDIYDLTRFNEAIDEALTQTEAKFSKQVARSRELFLGILGHDLRTPLGAITGSAELLMRSQNSDRNAALSKNILTSAGRMAHMISDLLELTRAQLGKGITIHPARNDMERICLVVLKEAEALYSDRVFKLDVEDNLLGDWDGPKIKQVLANLIGNAAQHGNRHAPVSMIAKKTADGIELKIHNEGPVISPEAIHKLFDRFMQGKSGNVREETQSEGLGLGLYIAKEIVVAHGGRISVRSLENEGTTFIVNLPMSSSEKLNIEQYIG